METGPQDSRIGAVGRGGTITAASFVSFAVLEFALVLAVTRGLGPLETGVFFSAVAIFTIVSSIAQLGTDVGFVRAIAAMGATGRSGDIAALLRIGLPPVVLASLAASAVGLLTAVPVSQFLIDGPGAEPYLRVLAAFLPIATLLKTTSAATQGFGTMLPSAVVERMLVPALRLALVLVAVVAGATAAGVALAWAVPLAAGLVGSALWLRLLLHQASRSEGKKPRRVDAGLARDFWRFSSVRGLAFMAQVSVTWIDIPLVAALASPRAAGIYAAASRLAIGASLVLRALNMSVAPQISALIARGNLEEVRRTYRVAALWGLTISLPLYAFLLFNAEHVLALFGEGFEQGAAALRILCVGWMIPTAAGGATTLLLMMGRARLNLANTAAGLVANVGLNVILIPAYGMDGAAVAWLVSLAILNGASLAAIQRLWTVHPFSKAYVLAAGAALVSFALAAAIASQLSAPPLIEASVSAGLGSLLYAGAVWRLPGKGGLEMLLGMLRARPQSSRPLRLP